jgi:hypothetical protein
VNQNDLTKLAEQVAEHLNMLVIGRFEDPDPDQLKSVED